ncbi:membrane protein S3 [Saimiriine betaherpesvirus 4]|uniref:Membrane protein S3 n=1 Tax=Saimiriine betaherpesvirus 4 TaxID=1535247 RepID=G8XSS1_9BETA|nr:membrane protein S3 [Saimiriine betaherpesvirus 4]AEV80868.1 membrane protein S3 [Saimiriine betaherpesvirus 4]
MFLYKTKVLSLTAHLFTHALFLHPEHNPKLLTTMPPNTDASQILDLENTASIERQPGTDTFRRTNLSATALRLLTLLVNTTFPFSAANPFNRSASTCEPLPSVQTIDLRCFMRGGTAYVSAAVHGNFLEIRTPLTQTYVYTFFENDANPTISNHLPIYTANHLYVYHFSIHMLDIEQLQFNFRPCTFCPTKTAVCDLHEHVSWSPLVLYNAKSITHLLLERRYVPAFVVFLLVASRCTLIFLWLFECSKLADWIVDQNWLTFYLIITVLFLSVPLTLSFLSCSTLLSFDYLIPVEYPLSTEELLSSFTLT